MKTFENPDHWDNAASHYEKTAHPFTSMYAEDALAMTAITPQSRVLDIAAGTGAFALAAARSGAQVLATDFSAGMVGRIAAAGLANVEAKVMDGQALDLPDAGFDVVASIFGVMMFPDWRKGLREMARVTRPGGQGVVATWQSRGAATFLLLGQVRAKLWPERESMQMPEAVQALSDPADFARELIAAGYKHPRIESATHDYLLDVAALEAPDTLFGMSPDWTSLSDAEKAQVVTEVGVAAGDRAVLAVPSTALIGVANR
ncbi:methyltransferase domain-containing protein [Sphingomonas sp. G-3-2-10]|uniref:class I SAM-dependent methyltransferase n=1 Tax=Sphingomonas sp. G-3-2-10 TaxID=2728838 RepID=UPI00146E6696|nr:methyltransferase domain-containing protein [Sphingomonas sp. G-3-2-10]NML07583.1 methyltransferase domain-containing protein [Sphingomonas sp. G-3-2-10]